MRHRNASWKNEIDESVKQNGKCYDTEAVMHFLSINGWCMLKGATMARKTFFFFFWGGGGLWRRELGKTFSGAEAICFSGSREFCRGSTLR